MKKQLLCTSAIALGVAAAPAAAQDWNLDWGGYMSQHVAFGDISGSAIPPGVDLDGDGLDIHSTSEIIFTPSVTLDNGMTFGVNIQIEGENQFGLTQIDESYMTISSDTFGTLDIGSENSAGYKSMVGAPGVTSMYINSPSISTFIPFSGVLPGNAFRQAGISSYTEVGGNNDVRRISYYTPDFNGLTVGVSYAPSGSQNVRNSYGIPQQAVLTDIFDIGVNYSNSFGSTDLTLAARWGTGDAPTGFEDPETWGVGFQVGFNNITVGGSWTENDNAGALPSAFGPDQEGWSFGATYDAAGPWAFEALTYQGEYKGSGTGGANEQYEAYRIGANRTLGPGVSWDIYVAHVTADDDGNPGTDLEGTILGTGVNLSF